MQILKVWYRCVPGTEQIFEVGYRWVLGTEHIFFLGTGYRQEKIWVPMDTGYREKFHFCRPLTYLRNPGPSTVSF